MASVLWDTKGIVLIDYVQKIKTINGEYYAQLLTQLWKEIKSKRPGKNDEGSLVSLRHCSCIQDCDFELVDHPPYIHLMWHHLCYVPQHERKITGWKSVSDRS